MSCLICYAGARVEWTFSVNDPTTVGPDDLSAVEWFLRIALPGSAQTIAEAAGVYEDQVVTVTMLPAETAELITGVCVWQLIAHTSEDDIVAAVGTVAVLTYLLPLEGDESS